MNWIELYLYSCRLQEEPDVQLRHEALLVPVHEGPGSLPHLLPPQAGVVCWGRGHIFTRKNMTLLIGRYQCVSCLCDFFNFRTIFGLIVAAFPLRPLSGHINVSVLDLYLLEFGLNFVTYWDFSLVTFFNKVQKYTCPCLAPNDMQSWALSVFFKFFSSKKWLLAFFNMLIWLGVGFLNSLGAEIGY